LATPPFPQEPSPALSVPLLAGQSTRIGSVNVRVEGADLVVEYALNPDWSLNETHLDIESNWTLIPQNKNHNPTPGKFAQKGQHPPGTRTVTYRRRLVGLHGRQLVLAAHADVVHRSGRTDGAWADGTRFTSQGNWATWFTYKPADQILLDQGPGWVLISVRGVTTDPPPSAPSAFNRAALAVGAGVEFEEQVYLLYGELGIRNAPLPDIFEEGLLESQLPDEVVHIVSRDTVDGLMASEAAGHLTPEIAAIAEPLDEEKGLFSRCATHEKTASKSYDLGGKNYDKDFDLGSGFKGKLHARGELDGSVTGELKYNVKRNKAFGACVPYAVGFNSAHLFGNADVNAEITLTGTYERDDSFGPHEVAKPFLGSVTFTVAYIPVHIEFYLPINVGMDLKTDVTGTVDYQGKKLASGSFDYTCTLNECHGSGDFNTDGSTNTITAGLSGHAYPEPWVDVGVRAVLYTDWFAYAQVGLRPYALGDLWGYIGNACGDADGDGSFETVRALTFDLDYRVDITGEASAFSIANWQRTLKTGQRSHAAFFKLIDSDAMQPQLHGPGAPQVGSAAGYQVQMRPCWPYKEDVTYQVNWGDGSAAQTLEGAPGTAVSASHTWSAVGDKTVTATSVSDKHGRDIDQDYSRTIQVKPCPAPAISQQPQSVSIDSGQSATLFVVSEGTAFQWYQGTSGDTSNPVSGATGNTLVVTPQQTTSYWVRVSKDCGGQVDSTTATVSINFSCQLPGTDGLSCGGDGNHTCQGGQCVCSNCASGVCCGATGNSACDGQTHVDPNTGYTGICTSTLPSCTAANDFDGTNTVYHDGEVLGCVKANGTYQWYPRRPSPRCQEVSTVCGFLCSTHYNDGSGFMCDQNGVWNQSPPLSYCYGGTIPDGWSCQLPPTCTPPQIISQPQSAFIQEGQVVTLSTAASGTSPNFQWYRGISGDTSNPLQAGISDSIVVTPSTTTSYWVRAFNGCGSADSQTATVTVSVICLSPSITTQPQSVTITAGQSATLSVGATGTSPLSYQWYEGSVGNTSNPVPGGTGPFLTVAPSTTTSYWVRISNACATSDSAGATITVEDICIPPSVLAQPLSTTIDQGDFTVLSVGASGTSLSYQWYEGAAPNTSNPVPGGTGDTLMVAPSSTTSYWVQVANDCGVDNSSTATVTVNVNGCGPDGTACGGDGHHTCQGGQCVCSDCGSTVCCGAPGNTYCDGQQIVDPNYFYTATCTSSLPACGPGNDFNGDDEVYHNGDVMGCVKYNGVHQWFPRRPSPLCQLVAQVCDYLCAYNYNSGMGFQCEDNGFWSQNPPLPYCFGGTIPESFLCN